MSSLSDNCSYFKDLLDDVGSSLVFSNVNLTPRKVLLFKASAHLHRRSGAYTTATSVVFTARCYASAVLAVGLCTSVCLCPSVTSQCNTNSAKHRITQTTPHDSPGTLVSDAKDPRNSTGVTPYEGAECRWGGSKSATFDK